MLQAFYRRKLPHLQRDAKPHFVTFCTHLRWTLPGIARSITLGCCMHDRDTKILLHAAVVMPDHAHLTFTPLVNLEKAEAYSLGEIMDAINRPRLSGRAQLDRLPWAPKFRIAWLALASGVRQPLCAGMKSCRASLDWTAGGGCPYAILLRDYFRRRFQQAAGVRMGRALGDLLDRAYLD